MQTEIQKMQLRQQPGMKEVFFHGGSVVVPEEEEAIYVNALADKWIDGHRVYIKSGKVQTDLDPNRHTMSPQTMIKLLQEENNKRYALAGKY